MGRLYGEDPSVFTLTDRHLTQIAEVFAPFAHPRSHLTPGDDTTPPAGETTPRQQPLAPATSQHATDPYAPFEQAVGAYYHDDPEASGAARAAVRRLFDVLRAAYPHFSHEQVAASFFTTDPTSAGQVGVPSSHSPSTWLEHLLAEGTTREIMTAFYNAVRKKSLYENDPSVPSMDAVLRTILAAPRGVSRSGISDDGMSLAAELRLDSSSLEAYAEFLHGGARASLQEALMAEPDWRHQARLFAVDEPLALGNLAAYGDVSSAKDPFEMAASQAARIERTPDLRSTGSRKKAPRDYTYLGVPLTGRERTFLARYARPISVVGFEIEEIPLDTLTYSPQTGEPLLTDLLSRPDVMSVEVQRRSLPASASLGSGTEVPAAPRTQAPVERVVAVTSRAFEINAGQRAGDLRHIDEQGPELPLSWVEGTAYFDLDERSAWYQEWHHNRGMPLIAGISGTTLRMLRVHQWLNVEEGDIRAFRKALMGWMLPAGDHSLFEIMRASFLADVSSPEEERGVNGTRDDLYAIPDLIPSHLSPPESLGGAPAVADAEPAVNYEMTHPGDRDFIVESSRHEILWRFSTAEPEQVFSNGFDADDPSSTVSLHDWTRKNGASPFVSTTRNRDLRYRLKPYRYEIVAARNSDPIGVDVEAALAQLQQKSKFPEEQEVAFTGGISPQVIASVYDNLNDRTGTWHADTREVLWTPGDTQTSSHETAPSADVPPAADYGMIHSSEEPLTVAGEPAVPPPLADGTAHADEQHGVGSATAPADTRSGDDSPVASVLGPENAASSVQGASADTVVSAAHEAPAAEDHLLAVIRGANQAAPETTSPQRQPSDQPEPGPVSRDEQADLIRQVAAQLTTGGTSDRHEDLPAQVAQAYDALNPAWRSQPIARLATLIATWIASGKELVSHDEHVAVDHVSGRTVSGGDVHRDAADVAPAVDYRLVNSADAQGIVPSRAGENLWRFSNAAPEKIFTEGFIADDVNARFKLHHVVHGTYDSQYISTTRDPKLWYLMKRYRYLISSARNSDPIGVDVAATFEKTGQKYYTPWEREVAFTGGVDAAAVVSVYDLKTERTGFWNAQTQQVEWRNGKLQNTARDAPPALSAQGLTAPVGAAAAAPAHSLPASVPAPTPVHKIAAGQVDTDLWQPFGRRRQHPAVGAEAFTLQQVEADGPPIMSRPPQSGERTRVSYAWTWHRDNHPDSDLITLVQRFHLTSDEVSEQELVTLQQTLSAAIDQMLNAPAYRLPLFEQTTHRHVPNPRLAFRAEFTGEPDSAHATITVRRGPASENRSMVQTTWFAGMPPAAYVHEFIHGLGVRDDERDPRILLTPGGTKPITLEPGQKSLMGPLDSATPTSRIALSEAHLRQIAEVLLPYINFGGSTSPDTAGTEGPARAHTADRMPATTSSPEAMPPSGSRNAEAAPVAAHQPAAGPRPRLHDPATHEEPSDTAPAVEYDLVHTHDKSTLTESQPGETLYRFSNSPPEEAFTEGFAAEDVTSRRIDPRAVVRVHDRREDRTGVWTGAKVRWTPGAHQVTDVFADEADVGPGVNYGMVHSEDRAFVVESQAGERLWRFSDRAPEEVFADGFAADDASSVVPSGEWVTENPPESPYVSTTRHRNPWFMGKRYRYRIDPALNFDPTGIDVIATLKRQKEGGFPLPADVDENFVPLSNEAEVSFTGTVQPQAVVSVYDRVSDRTGVYNRDTGSIAWSPGELDDGPHASVIDEEPPPYELADVAPAVNADGLVREGPASVVGERDVTVAAGVEWVATGGPGEPHGAGEVSTDRWIPFGSRRRADLPQAFVFGLAGDGTLLSVRRPPGSGERTEVGYAWTWYRGASPVDDVLHLTRRIHLRGEGVSPEQMRGVREGLVRALETHVNEQGHRLPVSQPDRVTGPVLPGPLLRVSAEFTDDPEAAHSVVTVRPGLPGKPHSMEQSTWYTDVYPVAWVHEFVHGLGVWDDKLDSRALLAPGGRAAQVLGEGDSSVMGPLSGSPQLRRFRLTPDHLMQIAAVFAPYAHAGQIPAPRGEVVRPADVTDAGAHMSDLSAAVDYDLIHPDDTALGVVESRPTETLWRFSKEAPESVFAHGFRADDVTSVVPLHDWALENPDAQFVSTTRDSELWYGNKRYRYRIDPARNGDTTGVDVNSTLAAHGDTLSGVVDGEAEVAFTRELRPEAIVSVYDRQLDRTGTWEPGPQGPVVVWRPGGRFDWIAKRMATDTAPAADYTMVHSDDQDATPGQAGPETASPQQQPSDQPEPGPVSRDEQADLIRQVTAQLTTRGISDRHEDLPAQVAQAYDALNPAWRSQPIVGSNTSPDTAGTEGPAGAHTADHVPAGTRSTSIEPADHYLGTAPSDQRAQPEVHSARAMTWHREYQDTPAEHVRSIEEDVLYAIRGDGPPPAQVSPVQPTVPLPIRDANTAIQAGENPSHGHPAEGTDNLGGTIPANP
ncbi:hypothetical protein ABZV75_05075 [Streptomyces flaveolus]|uniref:scabin-related ADP-ribosyltransferase n=1 Tax=Streptomyces flaveolus TaxID=67297 RepID=UPI0033AEEF24